MLYTYDCVVSDISDRLLIHNIIICVHLEDTIILDCYETIEWF